MSETIILTSKVAAEGGGLLMLADSLVSGDGSPGILFVGDGVYSLLEGSESQRILTSRHPSLKLFGCREDLQARGIADKVSWPAEILDYEGIVRLIMRHASKVVSYL